MFVYVCDVNSSGYPAPGFLHSMVKATAVVRVLRTALLLCAAYHAGLKDAERTRTLRDWVTGKIPVVAATIAFGYGPAFARAFIVEEVSALSQGQTCSLSVVELYLIQYRIQYAETPSQANV